MPRASTRSTAGVRVHAVGALNSRACPVLVVGYVAAARVVIRAVGFIVGAAGRRGVCYPVVPGAGTRSAAGVRVPAVGAPDSVARPVLVVRDVLAAGIGLIRVGGSLPIAGLVRRCVARSLRVVIGGDCAR